MTRKRPGDVLAHQRRRVLRARTQRGDHALLLGCIAESHGEIAQPALLADPQDRRACHPLAELALGPSGKLDELGAVEAVAHPEVRLRRDLRVAVPGADELAVVAAEDAVADERPELRRNATFQLDGQVGNAAPRIQRVRCEDRARRADVDALGAGAAMFAHRSVHRERKIRVDLAEKEKRARLAREQQRVLSPPAEPRLARQLHFHHRRRVGEHAVAEFADFAFDSSGELLHASPGLDRRCEHRKIGGPRRRRPPDRFHVTHPANHNQPSLQAHWAGYLPDEAATLRLGGVLAACIAPGMRIYLRGELGSGKTTLVRSLLQGLGAEGTVKSPSYALVELYVVSRLHLYHFDFYRIMNPSEFGDAGLADYFRDGNGVCMVEWPERAGGVLPPPDLELELAYSGTGRDINVRAFSEAGGQCLKKLRDDG